MEQRSNYAALRGAKTKFNKEECARGMGQRLNSAVLMGAQIMPEREECVLDMGQRSRSSDAAERGAKTGFYKEECA